MNPISYARLHYPPSVVQHAVWLYLRFNLSLRDVEDLLAERGLDVSYETVAVGSPSSGPPTPGGSARCDHGRVTPGTWTRSMCRSAVG